MSDVKKTSEANQFLAEHVALLTTSFKRWMGYELIVPEVDAVAAAEKLFYASFAVMSHNVADDPIFNYANQKTLSLFEMQWDQFVQTPSRLSAELDKQEERDKVLTNVSKNGFIENYSGIRISSAGRRFQINNAIIWNVIDHAGQNCGQAAMFKEWQYL